MLKLLTILICCFMAFSCGKTATPKPYEYFRIDLPQHEYRHIDSLPNISFDISTMSKISDYEGNDVKGYNIDYPMLNGRIYLTYMPLDLDSFIAVTEDSRRLAYKHTIKANSIIDNYYENDTTKVYSVLFQISGNAASPVQFFITDSTKNFLRGALYFNNIPNYDSIMPVADYVQEDIERLIETVRWK
ncbi:MAG: gliding motility lipoprotein GldD [Porphyromonadaceae bacterium]|nr:gliding motility lipoprotein GldD [Porphyromonadaceae bacterium]